MTDMPPFPPGQTKPQQPAAAMPYASAGPRASAMGIASMILGIIAIPTTCLLIGIPLGLVAAALGLIAMIKIGNRPNELSGKGFAITGLVTGLVAGIMMPVVIVPILLPSLGRARELSNRTYCAANVRGIVQSMNVYAADNSDAFPIVPYAVYGPGNAGISTVTAPGPKVDDAIASLYGASTPQAGSPLAAVWIVALRNGVPPKQFICKSDPSAGTTPASVQDASGNYFLNFQNDNQISYSFAYPYNARGGAGGWWKDNTDPSLPIMADMAPLNGTGKPARDVTASTGASGWSKIWNSGNHQGEGQNVGYSDGHAAFERRIDIGQNNDNIFTTGGPAGGVSSGGSQPVKSPVEISTEAAPYDIYMVPARNLDTGGL